jgi:hypothetical protein
MSMQSTHPRLGLRRNPFIAIPPVHTYDDDLRPLFCARDVEVEKIRRHALQANAVFVCAPFGGGKTVVVLEALSRLRANGAIVAYAQFERARGFQGSLRAALETVHLAPSDDSWTKTRDALRAVRRDGAQIVLSIDDLDRAQDIHEVYQVTHDVRDLLTEGASVLITGQPFGVTYDLHSSAGGIFREVTVPQFTRAEFHEMLVTYLRSVREAPDASDTHPFEPAAAEFICEAIAADKLTPRLFNYGVSEMLEKAEDDGLRVISEDFASHLWPILAARVSQSLTPQQMRQLEIIRRAGQLTEDSDNAINELGESKLAEYPKVRERVLRPLLEKDLVHVVLQGGKEQFSLLPHAALLVDEAQTPPDVRSASDVHPVRDGAPKDTPAKNSPVDHTSPVDHPSTIERDQVFVSYSHVDARWVKKLRTHLKPLERDKKLSVWVDTEIKPGAVWRDEITRALGRARIAVLLVSSDFLASDFIANNELPPILDAAKNQGLTVHWVLLSACNYEDTEVAKYQAAHDLAKPLAEMRRPNQENVLARIARGIREGMRSDAR